jgi:integrase
MSIFKRNGSTNYYIQFNHNGKTYVKSSKTSNRRVAEKMERDWKTQIHAQMELGELERITFDVALTKYYETKKRTGSHHYVKSNLSVIRNLFPVDRYVDELRDHDLVRFKSAREQGGTGPQTIKHNFNVIRGAVKWAKDHGYQVATLEYPKIKLPKHRLRYLSNDEEMRLLAELDPKRDMAQRPSFEMRSAEEQQKLDDSYELVVLLLDTGARYSEIANITWDRINLDERNINLWRSKVSNESIIYMTDRVYTILQRRFSIKSTEFVFTNTKGNARGYSVKGIRSAIKRAGLDDVTIHDLRHTCASRLVQNGLSIYEVSSILGHVDVKTTQRYAHLENKTISHKAMMILNNPHNL